MAIITKPTIAKGQANEIDLSKSDLAAVSKVVSDSYFSDQTNWSKVIVEYKSTEGKQIKQVVFDASQTTPKGQFELSDKSKDSWEVQALVIMDFDGGYLKLERGDLTVAEFDIAISSGDLGQDISAIYTAFNYLDVLRGDSGNPLDNSDYFGWSVSISGNYMVVGAYRDDDGARDSGAAYVYKINQDDTIAFLDTLKGDPNNALGYSDRFGWSVAISGNYIVVGAYADDGADNSTSSSGAAYVYKIDQDDNVDYLDTLRGDPNNPLGTDQFGYSVAISGDYIVVGAFFSNAVDMDNFNYQSGSAYVYKINQDDSIDYLATLRGDPNNPLDGSDYFGHSVAISGDYIVVGAYRDDGDSNSTPTDSGAAYVYKIVQGDQNDSVEYLTTLRGDTSDPNKPLDSDDKFGWSVAISGNYIVVGAYFDDGDGNSTSSSGAAYVYKIDQSNDSISLLDTLRGDPDNALGFNDQFGYSVAISGNYMVVGSETRNKSYVYKINQNDSIDLLDILTETTMNAASLVSIDNGYILVGNYKDTNYFGAAYVYKGIE